MTNGHSFLEKYTSNFIRNGKKGLRKDYVWEVSWRLNKTTTYWPQALLATAALFSRSPELLNRGPWRPQALSLELVLTVASYHKNSKHQLTELPVTPGYTIVWRSPASCERHICTEFNPSTVKAILWYLRPDGPVPWLTAKSVITMFWTLAMHQ